jgi:putative flippase GtrA
MLVAVKHLGIQLIQQPIRTIYEPGNRSSQFHPLRDSMRIYFVLLRFALISVLTAALDNAKFYVVFGATGNILVAQVAGRAASVLFQYPMARRAVFLSGERHGILLPRFLSLIVVNTTLAYIGIEFLTHVAPVRVCFPPRSPSRRLCSLSVS